jgi:hypothetical protein
VLALEADVEALLALVEAADAELAALVADVLALLACVVAVDAELVADDAELEAEDALDAALVALVDALEACVVAVDALVEALLADVDAALAEEAALVALVEAALALEAAALAEAVAEAASTRSDHLAASALVVIGCAPVDVCPVKQMNMLLVEVSLMMSYTIYATPADQLPLYVPTALLTVGLPSASNDKNLLARVVLNGNVMLIVVGSVTGAFSPRSAVSAIC